MRALLSVSDKTGLVEFATHLTDFGWEIVATGGTMKILKEANLNVINISEITGFPEICDGRVKTLHPKVHGGLLAQRNNPEHIKALEDNKIDFIDLVCVNLYPFSETIQKEGVTMEDAIENIDIGGPSMLRSAAKNWQDVTVVCNPDNYPLIIEEIKEGGNTKRETRLMLSAEAYTHTAQYDIKISEFMRKSAGLPEKLFLEYDIVQGLRYGENPHQRAKFYKTPHQVPFSIAFAEQLNGKELSYNNIRDANAAINIVKEFDEPFCVGVKHMNPCGAAIGKNITECWQKAYKADSISIFGGIVATNQEINAEVASMMKEIFLEIIIAPNFSTEALEILKAKKNLRLIKVDMSKEDDKVETPDFVSVNGGMLMQSLDDSMIKVTTDMCVTKTKPTDSQLKDLQFGLKIVKHIKSNAICVVRDGVTAGIGAGQMNRVNSVKIAIEQAHNNGVKDNLVLASDAFFPFDDSVELAGNNGVVSIVQPGGSIKDNDSIAKANEMNISMIFTGTRHFRH